MSFFLFSKAPQPVISFKTAVYGFFQKTPRIVNFHLKLISLILLFSIIQPSFASTKNSAAIKIFSDSLTYATVSYDDEAKRDRNEFIRFHNFLKRSFPLVHDIAKLEKVNNLSLLFTFEGSEPDLDPYLLMAHMDVVPAPNDNGEWTHDPFSGYLDSDGKIWGRGAFDNKISVLAILQAMENLLASGLKPTRTTYLAFGHDEEVGGHFGAQKIAELLYNRGVRLAAVLDEGGGYLSDGIVMGIDSPIGVIGIAEKGSVNIKLSVKHDGISHSMAPPAETPVGILAHAIAKMEDNPFPPKIIPSVGKFLDAISPYTPWIKSLALSNRWLLEKLVINSMASQPETNAMIRTVFSPNVLEGSNKSNSIPDVASAIFNVRILPGDTVDSIIDYFIDTINDKRVVNVQPTTHSI